MPLKKFHQFEKLPLEIRRRIWLLTIAPRIVRGRHQDTGSAKNYHIVYALHAGPVPRLLHINHESRTEGLRIYTAIASHLPFGIYKSSQVTLSAPSTRKIYVDLARDTFYFATVQTTIGFLGWLMILGNETEGGAGNGEIGVRVDVGDGKGNSSGRKKRGLPAREVKKEEPKTQIQGLSSIQPRSGPGSSVSTPPQSPPHPNAPATTLTITQISTPKPKPGLHRIAFPLHELLKIDRKNRIDFLLSVAMLQPHLQSISIVLNGHSPTFAPHQPPKNFWLRPAKPLPHGKRGNRIFLDFGDDKKVGFYRDDIEGVFEGFWVRERGLGFLGGMGVGGGGSFGAGNGVKLTEMEKTWVRWGQWLDSEERKDGKWKGAGFRLVDLVRATGEVL